MSVVTTSPTGELGSRNGGVPARRAVSRWAVRLFRREWRQHLLILALITIAVAGTVIGSGIATDSQQDPNFGFGSADYMATLSASGSALTTQIAKIHRLVGPVDVIENQAERVPGSVNTFDLRAQDPHGPYGGPMLSLVSGRYPATADEVALTSGLAGELHIATGDEWTFGGVTRHVVGIVQNPQSLLDEFALVIPGQVTSPTLVTVLFDTDEHTANTLGVPVAQSGQGTQLFNPETFTLLTAVIFLMLVGLVSVGGFTVLAQRRMRSFGMLASLGATDRNLRFVARANGLIVGVIGAISGLVVGIVAWEIYRPSLEQQVHHVIGATQLPWWVIVTTAVLAVITSVLAATKPVKAISRMPVVAALSGRPTPPKYVKRSAVFGVAMLVVSFFLIAAAGGSKGNGSGLLELLVGLVLLVAALVFNSPLVVSSLAHLAGRAPISAKVALRDLSRYRSRSSSTLTAISLGVLIVMMVMVLTSGRYADPLDFVGPNVSANELIVYTAGSGFNCYGPDCRQQSKPAPLDVQRRQMRSIASSIGSTGEVALYLTSASIETRQTNGRNVSGQVYVATPQLLKVFDIAPGLIKAGTEILSMRPDFASQPDLAITFNNYYSNRGPNMTSDHLLVCHPSNCLANPSIQEVPQLPSGTSGPNTVITEYAVNKLGLAHQENLNAWLITTAQPLTKQQITNARALASVEGMSVESQSSLPTSAEVLSIATWAGVILALSILAMSVGLIRSESQRDLHTLAAAGASSWTRRSITAWTSGALALLGALLGTFGAYVAAYAFSESGQVSSSAWDAISHVPAWNLLLILVIMPIAAFAGGWLFAGRQQQSIAQQPME